MRASSTGKLITRVVLPMKKPATKGNISVGALAAGSKGLAAAYSDGSKIRLALVDPWGSFSSKSKVLGSDGLSTLGFGWGRC